MADGEVRVVLDAETERRLRVRELPVRLGRYGYIVRYRVSDAGVTVTRLRHTRARG